MLGTEAWEALRRPAAWEGRCDGVPSLLMYNRDEGHWGLVQPIAGTQGAVFLKLDTKYAIMQLHQLSEPRVPLELIRAAMATAGRELPAVLDREPREALAAVRDFESKLLAESAVVPRGHAAFSAHDRTSDPGAAERISSDVAWQRQKSRRSTPRPLPPQPDPEEVCRRQDRKDKASLGVGIGLVLFAVVSLFVFPPAPIAGGVLLCAYLVIKRMVETSSRHRTHKDRPCGRCGYQHKWSRCPRCGTSR